MYSSDSAPQFCTVKESVCTVHHRFGYRTDPIGDRTASLLSKRACSNSGQLVWWVNRAVRCVAVRQSHCTITGAVTVRAVRRSHINLIDAPLVTFLVTYRSLNPATAGWGPGSGDGEYADHVINIIREYSISIRIL